METTRAFDRLLTCTKVLELSTGFTERLYEVANESILPAREQRLALAKALKTVDSFGAWQQAIEQLRPGTGGL